MSIPWVLSGQWSLEPQILLGLIAAATLYGLGLRYTLAAGIERHLTWWRPLCFGAGLIVIFVALESPVDAWAQRYLWAHMIQHALLIFAAAPLVLAGAPVMPVFRAIPLTGRRKALRWLMSHRRSRRFTFALGRFISTPRLVWLLFVGDYLAWHIPALYDLTLRDQVVHDAEHLLFLTTALLFWVQIVPSPPLGRRMGFGAQALYAMAAGFAMQVVEMVLTYSATPLYNHYAEVNRATGASSAAVDQASAGALMGAISTAIFGIVFMILLWRWIDSALQREAVARRGVAGPSAPPRFGH